MVIYRNMSKKKLKVWLVFGYSEGQTKRLSEVVL